MNVALKLLALMFATQRCVAEIKVGGGGAEQFVEKSDTVQFIYHLSLPTALITYDNIVYAAFTDEENCEDREIRWLSYCLAIAFAFGYLLLCSSH
ncbi:unnamed protein product [Rotaria socialis]|uniref:Uncharacterized protein n=1 Tax=Rotaria socialis TaxID=392032 RepID=A0A819Y7T3_9BILA|nr:unnamed protein product [Rotaria socialis]CAF3369555.1 unnamed protein product [Rotaria socialis]CAF3589543.1 unnamed protein product [Rotaria socialis]CAF4153813.1 unnamed protein product [Rotaria socialis]CAF4505175.1 unnamed protein product [Rotaria socialis]